MSSPVGNPTDAQLKLAADTWSTERWDAYSEAQQRLPAGRARYKVPGGYRRDEVPHNDVIKSVLFRLSKGRCWWQGGACKSRSILPREAQIDHIVPRTATGSQLRQALRLGSSQKGYFDVHDPANLAYICGPCNLAKKEIFPAAPAQEAELQLAGSRRDRIIKNVAKWYAAADCDVAGPGLRTMDVSDPVVQELYADLIADMVLNLARISEPSASLRGYSHLFAQSELWAFEVRPSDDAGEAFYESYQEMAWEDQRAEELYEEWKASVVGEETRNDGSA